MTLNRERRIVLKLKKPLTRTLIIWQLIRTNPNLSERFNDFRPLNSKIRRIRLVKWGDTASEVTRLRQKGSTLKRERSQREVWQLKIQKMEWIFTRFLKVALKSFPSLKVKTCTGAKTTSSKRGMMRFCKSEWMRRNSTGDRELMWAEGRRQTGRSKTKISLYWIHLCSRTRRVEIKQCPQNQWWVWTYLTKTRTIPRTRPSLTSWKQT